MLLFFAAIVTIALLLYGLVRFVEWFRLERESFWHMEPPRNPPRNRIDRLRTRRYEQRHP